MPFCIRNLPTTWWASQADLPARLGGLISATTWGASGAYREATPALTIRKVRAQFQAVQSIISMPPIYSVVGTNFHNLMSPTSQLHFRDAIPLGLTSF
jgi:hypothetical protein